MTTTTLTARNIGAPATGPALRGDAKVRIWLWVVAIFVFAMVVVGGATRLTESGLSITEWKPILGVIPPLTEADWLIELEKYRQIPEYQQINKGMSLADFQFIYWWEWGHRLLGRLVGFVFLLPFLWLAFTGAIRRPLLPALGGLFVLGGLQGAIGWWMVSSGLTERTDVSQYRLAVHLTLACVIFAATVWIAEGLRPRPAGAITEPQSLQKIAKAVVHLTLLQIFLGGLVAGLNAGYIYNTWPLMDGAIIPSGLFDMQPWWLNFFESHLTVQFVHRVGAYALFALALVQLVLTFRRALNRDSLRRAVLIFAITIAQAAVGIATLLHVVPLGLALAHQAMAVVLLGAATVHARRLKPAVA